MRVSPPPGDLGGQFKPVRHFHRQGAGQAQFFPEGLGFEHGAVAVEFAQKFAVRGVDVDSHPDSSPERRAADGLFEFGNAHAGFGRHDQGVREPRGEAVQGRAVFEAVDLVEHGDGFDGPGVDIGEHFLDRFHLGEPFGIGDIDDMKQQVGFADIGEGRPERRHQFMRQVPDEPDRIGNDDVRAVAAVQAAGHGVEGLEQAVFDRGVRMAQGIEQGRFARIGVADQGYRECSLAVLAGGVAALFDLFQFLGEVPDAIVDAPAVDL